MSSVAGVRLGLCLLRCGSQPGGSVVVFCRHNVADTRWKNSAQQHASFHGLSAVAANEKRKPFTVDMSKLQEEMRIAQSVKAFRRFITDPQLANDIVESLDPWKDCQRAPIIMECNPGPGVLTRALLNAGCNVVALESNVDFLPSLKKLESISRGRLRVVHCDFFRLDPWDGGNVQAPTMFSSTLMEQLGIREVPWDTDVPIKVLAMLRHVKERAALWRNIYFLYERMSLFQYGRVEFNFFMTESTYQSLCTKPGDLKQYIALPVLYNLACDIRLLHKEPISNFFSPKNVKGSLVRKSGASSDHLCLASLTPRKDLFSEHFTPADGKSFISMVKQCLAKRTSRLLDRLESWNPGNGQKLLQHLNLPETVKTGYICPADYKLLYEMLVHSEDFSQSFFFDDDFYCLASRAY